MEAGEGAAGDGDEEEGEERPGEGGTGARRRELGDRRHLHLGARDEDADREQRDRADLHVGRQVVAGGEEQPDREHRRGEAVADEQPGQRDRLEGEGLRQRRVLGDPAATDDGRDEQGHADERDLADRAGPQVAQVQAHEERDGDGHRDGEDTPGGVGQGADDDDAQDGDEDEHDGEHTDDRGGAPDPSELVAGHLPEAASAASDRQVQDHVVLHRSGEDDADDDPQGARQVAHLGGEHGADERPGTGDRGEVVPEEHPPVRRHEVLAVFELLCGSGALVARLEHLVLDEPGVEAKADDVGAHRGEDEPDGVDVLAPDHGDHRPADRPEQGDEREDELLPSAHRVRRADGDGGTTGVGADSRDAVPFVHDGARCAALAHPFPSSTSS